MIIVVAQKGKQMNKDIIYRQDATNALKEVIKNVSNNYTELDPMVMTGCGFIEDCIYELESLSSAQPEQTKMIKEIRKWINSGNRGSADYFIVDKIEEIINKYE